MPRRDLNVEIYNNSQRRNIILMHGWGFDNKIWQPILKKLSNNFNLYLVDLPGFGLSKFMDWETFKSELLEKIPDNYIFLGWSLGGLYATKLVLEKIPGVTHLVNIASSPRFLEDVNWPGVEESILENFYDNLITDTDKTLVDFINLQLRLKSVEYNFKPTKKPSTKTLQSGLKALKNFDLRDDLNSIELPVCYCFGRLDSIVPVKVLNTMQKMYPKFNYLLFPKSAHAPFLSHSEQFINEITTFVERN